MNVAALKKPPFRSFAGTDEAVLRKGGFTDVERYLAALSFRGWVAFRA